MQGYAVRWPVWRPQGAAGAVGGGVVGAGPRGRGEGRSRPLAATATLDALTTQAPQRFYSAEDAGFGSARLGVIDLEFPAVGQGKGGNRVVSSDRQTLAAEIIGEVVSDLSKGSSRDLLSVVRRLARAAELLGWEEDVTWLNSELNGYPGDSAPNYRQVTYIVGWQREGVPGPHFTTVDRKQLQRRTVRGELSMGLGSLLRAAEVGTHWHTGKTQNVVLDAGYRSGRGSYRDERSYRELAVVRAEDIWAVLDRIEQRCWTFAVRAEAQLRFGALVGDLFDEYRNVVEGAMAKLGIAESLDAIEHNLRLGTPESSKLAIHGCRNLLIALADRLWQVPGLRVHPSLTTYDGQPLQLDANQVKARLRAYLHERSLELATRRGPTVIAGQLERLADAVDQLYNLSSDQAKNEATLDEAKAATLHTYFLVAEIARLTDLEIVTQIGSGTTT